MSNPNGSIVVVRGPEEMAAAAADLILAAAGEAIQGRGRFNIALAGGSTPESAYGLLTQPPRRDRANWSRWHVFFGDDRFVPHDDSRSNYAMAKRSLFDHVPIPAGQIHAIPTDQPTPGLAAAAYARTLADAFDVNVTGPPPRFDLILLGMGDDGHTASLFPGKMALNESGAWVTWCPPGSLPPPVDRVTFTFPTINAARRVLFLVGGAKKAEVLREVLEGATPVS